MAADRSGAWVRAETARAVDRVVADGRSLDDALAAAENNVPEADHPLLRMLAYGSLRHHYRLRWQLRQLLDRPLKKRDRIIESLLVVGLFQLSDTRVPDHAAVSMTVDATRLLRQPKYAGLVNAVMRNFVRRKIAEREPDDEAAMTDHPGWLLERLKADWPEDWQAIVDANNSRAPMWLRVNGRKSDPAAWIAGSGADASPVDGFEQAVRLAAPAPVASLPGFGDGAVSVQDAAAQLAAPWLLRDGGRRVLDACAAPGGKTGHLLELLDDDADLVAVDSDADRLARVQENLDRLGLTATLVAADASDTGSWWDGVAFDRILLDAPCSASGVIRRHPDIKVLRRDEDIPTLAGIQASLLEALWPLLEPGGRLLYVTCSVLAEENESVVGAFLAAHPDATEDRVLQNNNIRDLMRERDAGFQVLPGTEAADGFYFACLEKTSPEP